MQKLPEVFLDLAVKRSPKLKPEEKRSHKRKTKKLLSCEGLKFGPVLGDLGLAFGFPTVLGEEKGQTTIRILSPWG